MTSKTLEWLNQNRFRAYPFVNDENLLDSGRRIPDCVLLDCTVMDTRHLSEIPEFVFTGLEITEDSTTIRFTYSGISSSYVIREDSSSDSSSSDTEIQDHDNGEGEFVTVEGNMISGLPSQFLYMKLVFSSHRYILNKIGTGTWSFRGKILPTKIVSVTASGISGIHTNGSQTVSEEGTATGVVHLKDGYRTQPVIDNGRVLVKVGNNFGIDPCHYPRTAVNEVKCSDLLLFFCGQNAITSGNFVLKGGPGVNVIQGGKYTVKEDIIDTYGNIGASAGEEIPCIEICASSELMRIYRPTVLDSSSSSGS